MSGESSTRKRGRSTFLDNFEELDEEAKERYRQKARDQVKYFLENPLPKQTDEDRIRSAKSALRDHISVAKEQRSRTAVLFFIEIGPESSQRGATCQHVTCEDRIKEGSYRIAVHPGMNNVYKSPGRRCIRSSSKKIHSELTAIIDFYHVRCFEDLADFSQAMYLDRIQPLTRNTAGMRQLKRSSVADGNYLLDGGSERLVMKWKSLMGQLMDQRDGVAIEPLDPNFNDLLEKSGSATYQPKSIDGMSRHEFLNLSMDLAPIESDGVDDREEWNLFEQYLSMTFTDLEDLNEPHSLSDMLNHWEVDRVSYKHSLYMDV